jgi:hypothetical protein
VNTTVFLDLDAADLSVTEVDDREPAVASGVTELELAAAVTEEDVK